MTISRSNEFNSKSEFTPPAATIGKGLINPGKVFSQTEIEKAIEHIGTISDISQKQQGCRLLFRNLVASNEIDSAIKVAKLYSRPGFSLSDLLSRLSWKLAEEGDLDRSVEVAQQIYQLGTSQAALINVTKLTLEKAPKEDDLLKLYAALAKGDLIQNAIEVGQLIPNQQAKDIASMNVFKSLVKSGNTDLAVEVINLISCEAMKADAWKVLRPTKHSTLICGGRRV